MPTIVTDPDLIQRAKKAAGRGQGALPAPPTAPAGGRVVTDPEIVKRARNRAKFQTAAKKKRILLTGEDMPDLSAGTSGPPTMEGSRVTQAFEAAADPRANQPFPLPPGSEYGFSQNMMSRLPFGDETAALGGGIGRYLAGKSGLNTDIPFSEAWNYGQAINRAGQEQYRGEHPGGDIGGSLLGMAVGGPTGAARAFGIRAAPAAAAIPATVAGRAAEGITGGATLGGLYGAGEGEGLNERAINMAKGTAIGATVGAALPYLGAAARPLRRLRNAYEPAIGGHVQRLEQEADNFYTQMDQAGVQLSQPAFNRILTNIRVRARNANIDPELHPGATAATRALVRDMQDLGRAPTLRRMDQIRRKIRDAPAATNDERRILRTMVEGLDENLNRLTPRDLTGGNLQTGMAALKEGRRLQKQMYKAETVDTLIENAKDALGANYTQAGLQTGIRQQFRALNKKIRTNAQERGRWTNEERLLINRIVRGGKGENIGRWLGMLALRGKSGASAYATATGAGAYTLGPAALPLAAGAMAVGEGAKRISTARGIMNAEALDRLIAGGTGAAGPRQLGPVAQGFGELRRGVVGKLPQLWGLGDRLLTGEQ